MDLARLYDILVQLPPGPLAEVCATVPEPHTLPGGSASRAEIALAVRQRAGGDPAVGRAIEAVLDRLGVVHRLDVVVAFQARQLADARHVPIIGFHDKARVRLRIDDVYVPLGFGPERTWLGGPGRPDGVGEARPPGDIPIEDGCEDLEQRIADGAVLHGLAVVGLPGSGKTTLLKHVYRRVRESGSDHLRLPAGLTPVMLRAGRVLERADGEGRVVRIPPEGRAEVLRGRTLAEVLEREALATGEGFAGAGRALAEAGPLLLLVDALDEAGGEAGLRDVCAWLDRQMASGGHRWVVTCRYAAWVATEGRLRGGLSTLHVRDLPLPVAHAYVTSWFRAVARHEGSEGSTALEDRARELADEITDPKRLVSGRLRAMVGNPLMLSLVCLVHHTLGHLPQARAKLYEECLGVLLVAWAEHKATSEGALHPKVQLDVDAAIRLLMPLAWQMQREQLDDEPVDVPGRQIEALFAEQLPRLPALASRKPDEMLRLLSEHCGVLHSPDLRTYRFAHLSLQEYLAARDAESRTDAGARELVAHLGEARWREPILLALSRGTLIGAFWRAALARPDVAAHGPLLREALEQGGWLDEAPFVEVLGQAAAALDATPPPAWRRWLGLVLPRRPGPPTSTVRLALELLGPRATPTIREAVAPLCRHPDTNVALMATAMVGTTTCPVPASGSRRTIDCGGVPLEVVWVPAGSFWMGATLEPGQNHDPEAYDVEGPVRRVTITRGFWLGRHPVTVAQYRAFCVATGHDEPEAFRYAQLRGEALPITTVNWEDARAFAAWLSTSDGLRGALPTEAEWEWAAQGGDGRRYPWGDEPPDLERAWYGGYGWDPERKEWVAERGEHHELVRAPAAVGGRPRGAGPFGAEDLAGNVWEWCEDAWGERHLEMEVDPCHHDDTPEVPRVVRGGAWSSPSRDLRCSFRCRLHPRDWDGNLGFRVSLRPDT